MHIHQHLRHSVATRKERSLEEELDFFERLLETDYMNVKESLSKEDKEKLSRKEKELEEESTIEISMSGMLHSKIKLIYNHETTVGELIDKIIERLRYYQGEQVVQSVLKSKNQSTIGLLIQSRVQKEIDDGMGNTITRSEIVQIFAYKKYKKLFDHLKRKNLHLKGTKLQCEFIIETCYLYIDLSPVLQLLSIFDSNSPLLQNNPLPSSPSPSDPSTTTNDSLSSPSTSQQGKDSEEAKDNKEEEEKERDEERDEVEKGKEEEEKEREEVHDGENLFNSKYFKEIKQLIGSPVIKIEVNPATSIQEIQYFVLKKFEYIFKILAHQTYENLCSLEELKEYIEYYLSHPEARAIPPDPQTCKHTGVVGAKGTVRFAEESSQDEGPEDLFENFEYANYMNSEFILNQIKVINEEEELSAYSSYSSTNPVPKQVVIDPAKYKQYKKGLANTVEGCLTIGGDRSPPLLAKQGASETTLNLSLLMAPTLKPMSPMQLSTKPDYSIDSPRKVLNELMPPSSESSTPSNTSNDSPNHSPTIASNPGTPLFTAPHPPPPPFHRPTHALSRMPSLTPKSNPLARTIVSPRSQSKVPVNPKGSLRPTQEEWYELSGDKGGDKASNTSPNQPLSSNQEDKLNNSSKEVGGVPSSPTSSKESPKGLRLDLNSLKEKEKEENKENKEENGKERKEEKEEEEGKEAEKEKERKRDKMKELLAKKIKNKSILRKKREYGIYWEKRSIWLEPRLSLAGYSLGEASGIVAKVGSKEDKLLFAEYLGSIRIQSADNYYYHNITNKYQSIANLKKILPFKLNFPTDQLLSLGVYLFIIDLNAVRQAPSDPDEAPSTPTLPTLFNLDDEVAKRWQEEQLLEGKNLLNDSVRLFDILFDSNSVLPSSPSSNHSLPSTPNPMDKEQPTKSLQNESLLSESIILSETNSQQASKQAAEKAGGGEIEKKKGGGGG